MAPTWLHFPSGQDSFAFWLTFLISITMRYCLTPAVQDPPRDDTKDTIEKTQDLGLEVKMITGRVTCTDIRLYFPYSYRRVRG